MPTPTADRRATSPSWPRPVNRRESSCSVRRRLAAGVEVESHQHERPEGFAEALGLFVGLLANLRSLDGTRVPALFAAAYPLLVQTSWRRLLLHVAQLPTAVVASAGWWVLIVAPIPERSRPTSEVPPTTPCSTSCSASKPNLALPLRQSDSIYSAGTAGPVIALLQDRQSRTKSVVVQRYTLD